MEIWRYRDMHVHVYTYTYIYIYIHTYILDFLWGSSVTIGTMQRRSARPPRKDEERAAEAQGRIS